MTAQDLVTRPETTVQETREEARTVQPPVDIFENEDGLTVVADVPGAAKEGVDVRVDKDILTISAKAAAAQTGALLYKEFELRDYYRQFQLGEKVDQEKIKAELKNGVLIIRLPRKEETKPKRISVSTS